LQSLAGSGFARLHAESRPHQCGLGANVQSPNLHLAHRLAGIDEFPRYKTVSIIEPQ
jgi:hypothetical protein